MAICWALYWFNVLISCRRTLGPVRGPHGWAVWLALHFPASRARCLKPRLPPDSVCAPRPPPHSADARVCEPLFSAGAHWGWQVPLHSLLFAVGQIGGSEPCFCYPELGKLQISFCSCVPHNHSSFYFSRLHTFLHLQKNCFINPCKLLSHSILWIV